MLRSRKMRREESLEEQPPPDLAGPGDPEHNAVVADSVGLALIVVLEALTPVERVAFVLHDLFGVPFDEIAPIVDRTPEAARQLASRARRRVRGADPSGAGDIARRREIVEAFLAASREGRFDALIALLDPDVVLRADTVTVKMGAEEEVLGAPAVAETFSGRAKAAHAAIIDGDPGAVWSQAGVPRVVFRFVIVGEKIAEIEMLSDPDRLAELDVAPTG
jgi:RNA polymerase sigma-70 factor (ECF subfamily)